MNKLQLSITAIVLGVSTIQAQHNNELFVAGDMYITNGAGVYVMGDVKISSATGNLNNSGLIEVQGDWYRIGSAQYNANYQGLSSGTVEFRNNDVNTGQAQMIDGDMTGVNSFYNLTIDNYGTAGVNRCVYLNSASTEVRNQLAFTQGRIRTAPTSLGSDGSAYPYEVYINNTTPSAMTGYALSGTDRYVEGRLSRQVSGAQTYEFPLGVSPSTLDGEEPFRLRFSAADNRKLTSFLRPGTQGIALNNIIYHDLGTDSDPSMTNGITTCTAGPDGRIDRVITDCNVSHEWVITPSTSGAFTYGIDVMPGAVMDASCSYITQTCGASTWTLKYLAKDGHPGGTPTPYGLIFPWQTAGYQTAPTGNTINNQVGFSTFRLHAVSNPTNTVLPITLLYLRATGIDDTYIRLDWATATERNAAGFYLERSTDGINFSEVTWQDATGNTTENTYYGHDDYGVLQNVVYYYRLKMLDNDGSHRYSDIVSARLNGRGITGVTALYPNPVLQQNAILEYTSTEETQITMRIYNNIGQIVYSTTQQINIGVNAINLPASAWAPASYNIVISDGSNVHTEKLLVSE